RLDAVVLVAPEPPGPRDTRLDLVDDEEGTRLIAELPEPAQVVLVGDVDPALALDALDEHAGGAVIDRALHRAQVVVGHVLEAGQERRRRLLDGPGHARMAVPQRGHGDAGAEVEVFAPVGIPYADAFAAHEHDGRPGAVVRGVILRRPFEERLGIHRRRPHRT